MAINTAARKRPFHQTNENPPCYLIYIVRREDAHAVNLHGSTSPRYEVGCQSIAAAHTQYATRYRVKAPIEAITQCSAH